MGLIAADVVLALQQHWIMATFFPLSDRRPAH